MSRDSSTSASREIRVFGLVTLSIYEAQVKQGTPPARHRRSGELAHAACVCVSAIDYRRSRYGRQSLETVWMNNCVDPELLDEGGWADGRTDKNITFVLETVDKSPKVYTQLAGFCGWVPEALCNPAQMRTQGGPAFRGSQARIPRDVCVASYEAAREAYEFRGSHTCSCFRLYTILRSRVLLLSCLVCMLGRSCIGVSADTRRGSPVM